MLAHAKLATAGPSRLLPSRTVPGRYSSTRFLTTIGIRKEDPKRVWERRAPLTPEAVEQLVNGQRGGKAGDVRVEVESCARRCFSEADYRHAGASVVPSLTGKVDLVLGIKEPPVPRVQALLDLEPGKKRKWMVFSHTHKGQRYNTPLLSTFMDKHASQTLIDYELLTAPTGETGDLKRVAAFGWYAGSVGAGEALCMTALALLRRGVATPLLQLPRPYTFASLDEYKPALRRCGDAFRQGPVAGSSEGPVVIGITGGNVSTGARDMLEAIGVEWVKADALPFLSDTNKVYACMITPTDYLSSRSGTYDRSTYYSDPSSHSSAFAERVAPYLTTLINGAGWQPGYPRMMSNQDLEGMVQKEGGKGKMVAIQDVACDLQGGLEFLDRTTTIDEPHWEGPGGILISSTDILPTELPIDASKHFSSKILPYVKHLVGQPVSNPTQVQETISRATIVQDGQLQHSHEKLLAAVQAWRSGSASPAQTSVQRTAAPAATASSQTEAATPKTPTAGVKQKKRVLLLGSGLVAGPAVEVLAARSDVSLVIASNNLQEASKLVGHRQNVEAFALDVSDDAALGLAVSRADVVVSLLPAPMHVGVAQHCLTHGKHLVTASYVSPEMKALDAQAKERDVLLLGECGLDPGIDSMAAMRILNRVQRENKRVTSFVSWCGGLPEPSAADVPFGYKFSWSPKAVLTAAGNDAQYKLAGEVQSVKGDDLLRQHFPNVDLWPDLQLEGLANRDSMPYAGKYGLGEVEQLQDLFRGTLRYKGFSRLLNAFRQLGLLSIAKLGAAVSSPPELLNGLLRRQGSGRVRDEDQMSVVKETLGDAALVEETVDALKWLGIWSSAASATCTASLNLSSASTPLDVLAAVLSSRLAYSPGERDMCLLHHSFILASGEKVSASLRHYGTPEASSMSITVGKTLAFAALRVLDGHVAQRGVTGPYRREVWEGVLGSLEEVGVEVVEQWEKA